MPNKLTTLDWSDILQDSKLTKPIDISIFQALYSMENFKASASQIGKILGNTGKAPHSPINSEIGRYAKRISEKYELPIVKNEFRRTEHWPLFFNGWWEGKYFFWQLRPELVEALEITGLTGDAPLPDEIPFSEEERLSEGAKRTIVVNAYERNSRARELCIKHYGTTCVVCAFDFEKIYGELGKGYIHVHHLTPLSEIGRDYKVDPIEDLRPVCPNCHAMLHREDPALSIDELKYLLKL